MSTYDAARLILEAVDRAGLNRARIRDEISRARFEGIGGAIRFNELGGNVRAPTLLTIDGGRWKGDPSASDDPAAVPPRSPPSFPANRTSSPAKDGTGRRRRPGRRLAGIDRLAEIPRSRRGSGS